MMIPAFILAVFPPLFLVVMAICCSTDVPWNDQWDFARILDQFYSGTLSLQDFWSFHNEHRIPVARAVLLLLAWTSHWNLRVETAGNLLLGAAIFAIILRKARTVAPEPPQHARYGLLAVISTLVFSLSQWQSWFFGWQLGEYLHIAAVLAGFLLLTSPKRGWIGYAGAVGMGLAATFSFGTGLMYWPAGALALELYPVPDRGTRNRGRLAWWCIWLIVHTAVLAGYHRPERHPSLLAFLSSPGDFLGYVLVYFGSPVVAYDVRGAAVAGGLGLLVFMGLLLALRRRGAPVSQWGFGLLLAFYVLLVAVGTAVARLGFGVGQALSSRYIPISTLFWVALVLTAYSMFLRLPESRWPRSAFVTAGTVLLMLLMYNSRFGANQWLERYDFRLPARAELLHGGNADLLRRLHPDPSVVIEGREVMRRHRLGVFRGPE